MITQPSQLTLNEQMRALMRQMIRLNLYKNEIQREVMRSYYIELLAVNQGNQRITA